MKRLLEFALRLRLMVLLLTGCTLWAQEPVKRLESVRIDPQTCKLTWTVTEGTKDADGKFTPVKYREFSIDLEAATMEELTLTPDSYPGGTKRETHEVREFDPREAKSVHRLTDALAQYSGDSTGWWDQGMGRKKPEGRIAVDKRFLWPARPVVKTEYVLDAGALTVTLPAHK